MLSRVANSIYWMNRYIERAENVARFIRVNLNLTLDMPTENGNQWEPLVMITGDRAFFEKRNLAYTKEEVVRFLTFDRDYPNSIFSCVAAARENARSIREIISSDMWEHMNNFYLELKDAGSSVFARTDPHRFFKDIQMRSLLFAGLLDGTMSHGEEWNFAKVGMLIERADKTTRILDVKYFMLLPRADLVNTPYDNIQWMAVLKSASALEMFRRRQYGITPQNVADFLIFDSRFPRSIRHCISNAQVCLHRITGSSSGSAHNAAEKRLGRLVADLEYIDIDEVIEGGLHEYLDGLQTRINLVDDAIGEAFFNLRPLSGTTLAEQ